VVVVDAGVRARLAADHQRIEGQAPTEAQIEEAVDRWIADQVLRREARALGLDRGDVVVERRLAQKMAFLLRSEADPPDPTDDDLRPLLEGRAPVPGTFRFEHRVFRSSPTVDEDARVGLQAVQRGDLDVGDPFIHGLTIRETAPRIEERFGPGFAEALEALPVGAWAGPISSSYGLHVVRLEARTAPTPATLETHREALTKDWRRRRRDGLEQERIRRLVDRYEVRREDR
jgi:hypothetical protein